MGGGGGGVGGMPYEMHRLGGRNEDGLAHVVVMKSIRYRAGHPENLPTILCH